jgi:hypothetical protein
VTTFAVTYVSEDGTVEVDTGLVTSPGQAHSITPAGSVAMTLSQIDSTPSTPASPSSPTTHTGIRWAT